MKHCKKLAAIASALLVLGFTACSSDGDGGSSSNDSTQAGIPVAGMPTNDKDKNPRYIGSKDPLQAKEVGDIVFSDGSATPYRANLTLTEEQKKSAIAVIFYASPSYNSFFSGKALGIGLKQGRNLEWAIPSAEGYGKTIESILANTSSTPSSIKDIDFDGSDNYTKLCSAVSDANVSGNYPAWEWAASYGKNNSLTGEYATGWYMPNFMEFEALVASCFYHGYSGVLLALKMLDGDIIDDSDDYWTSSDSSSSSSEAETSQSEQNKGTQFSVLAIRAFKTVTPATQTGYIGIKPPSAEKSVGDIVFTDGSATPSYMILDVMFNRKEAVAKIFYVGKKSDDLLGARTLGVGLKEISGSFPWRNAVSSMDFPEIKCNDSTIEPEKNIPYYPHIVGVPIDANDPNSNLIPDTSYLTGDFDGSDNWSKICEKDPDKTKDAVINYPLFYAANNYTQNGTLTGDLAKNWYVPTAAEFLIMAEVNQRKSLGIGIGSDVAYWTSSISESGKPYYVKNNTLYSNKNMSDDCRTVFIREFQSSTPTTPTTPKTPSAYIGSKSPKKAKNVGDIVFTDGSSSPYTETLSEKQKKNAVAVIFYAGAGSDDLGSETLGVGVNTDSKKWASAGATGASTLLQKISSSKKYSDFYSIDFDGSDNWKLLCEEVDDENMADNYPAWEWANAYGENNNLKNTAYEKDWYIPAVGEFEMMEQNQDIINIALKNCGKEMLSSDKYWSSNQADSPATSSTLEESAFVVNLDKTKSDLAKSEIKTTPACVCVIRAF